MNQSLTASLQEVMQLVTSQTALFTSTASFYDRPGGADPILNSLGQPDLTTLIPVPGLQDLPCQISAAHSMTPYGARRPDHFEEIQQRHVLLNAYYPDILMRYTVVVDGTAYELTPGAIDFDSQKTITQLGVRSYSL